MNGPESLLSRLEELYFFSTTYIKEISYTKDNNQISNQVINLDSYTKEACCAWLNPRFQIEHDFSVTCLKAQNV